MGTRADFYVGRGTDAEWIGSIAWDGGDIDNQIRQCQSPESFRHAVESFLKERDDATWPKDGWPWPWETSSTTDYAHAFDGDRTFSCCFGGTWWDASNGEPDHDELPKWPKAVFPNMKEKQKVTFGKRSGVLIVGLK
jgi:hypothetical protein